MPQIFMHRINDRRQIQISRQQLEGSGRAHHFKGREQLSTGGIAVKQVAELSQDLEEN